MIVETICGVLMIMGAMFAFTASLGLLRFPDVYSRMHASTKAGTLGTGLILLAVAIFAADLSVTIRAIAGIAFLIITAPIAGHMLCRSAYLAGVPLGKHAAADELAGKYPDRLSRPRAAPELNAKDYL